jgi:hypothetical protein
MRRLRDPDTLLFLALLVLHVAPLWAFPFFPSQDGPTHLENAAILRDYHHRPFLQQFYLLSDRFDPNWFGHLVLAGLMSVFPPLIAEKVLLTGYVVLLPLAAWYALDGVRPGAGWLAVLVFPFVHSFPYHMGFHNFCYSLGAFFLVAGYWLRHYQHFGLRQTLILAALLVLLYFCHLVAVVMALMMIGTLAVGWALLDYKAGPGAVGRTIRYRLLGPALAFVPALALGLGFVGRQGTTMQWGLKPAQLLGLLTGLEVLVSYFKFFEGLLSRLLFWGLLLLVALVLVRRWRGRLLDKRDLLLVVAALALLAYFTAPSAMSGGLFVNTRLSLFLCFFVILWLAGHPFTAPAKRVVQGAAALVALGLLAVHTAAYAEFNAYLDDYLSAEAHLEKRDATLLPLPFAHQLRVAGLGDAKLSVFRHAAGYLAARRGVVELENYEATSGYFPVQFRPEVDPYKHLSPGSTSDAGIQGEPPTVDIARYEATTHRTIDYVLLWQWQAVDARDEPAARRAAALFDQLAPPSYELIYTSPRGLLRLYRRKDLLYDAVE